MVPTANVARFEVPLTGGGELQRLDVFAPNVAGVGYWYINVRINGVAQFTGEDRLKVNTDNRSDSKTGLTIAIADGDVIAFDVEVAGTGALYPYLECCATVEDGDTGGGSGTVETIVEGTGIDVDDTDPANPIVAVDTTVIATKSYADSLVTGLLDDRGNFDASGNVFPSSGGSGTAGAILKGDLWTISVAGTLGGVAVGVGDVIRAIVDTPGNTLGNWAITEHNFGYVAENAANKDTDGTLAANSDTLYASQKATKTYADGKVAGAGTVTDDRIVTFDGTTGKAIQDSGAVISTDGTLASNSDAKVPTEKAVKTYADSLSGGVTVLDDLSDVAISSPTLDEVLKYNGSNWENAATPGAGWTVLQVGADETYNSTTYADSTALQFGIDANSYYHVGFKIWFLVNSGSTDIKFRYNLTQTPQNLVNCVEWVATTVSVPAGLSLTGAMNTVNPGTDRVVSASGFWSFARLDMNFFTHASSPGTWKLQIALNSGTGTVALRNGSAVWYRKS